MYKTEKQKNLALIIISTALFLFCMYMIFMFSYQSAGTSSKLSGSLYAKFISLTHIPISHNTFRKLAHFSEFCAFGFCTTNLIYQIKKEQHPFFAFLFCFLYSVSDEIHQIFVPGRACRAFDVFVDSMGIVIGLIVFEVLILLIYNLQSKKAFK